MKDILFLPVKPKWADLIMSGKKTLELRKRLPQRGQGSRCIIYATSPRCEVIGACTFDSARAFRADQADGLTLARARVTTAEFDAYFDKAFWARFEDPFDERWYGIELMHATPFTKPITLETLRARWHIDPPQQWRYIDGQTFDEIVEAGQ